MIAYIFFQGGSMVQWRILVVITEMVIKRSLCPKSPCGKWRCLLISYEGGKWKRLCNQWIIEEDYLFRITLNFHDQNTWHALHNDFQWRKCTLLSSYVYFIQLLLDRIWNSTSWDVWISFGSTEMKIQNVRKDATI